MKFRKILLLIMILTIISNGCNSNTENTNLINNSESTSIDLMKSGKRELVAQNNNNVVTKLDVIEISVLSGEIQKITLNEESLSDNYIENTYDPQLIHYVVQINMEISNYSNKEVIFNEVRCKILTQDIELITSLIMEDSLKINIEKNETKEAMIITSIPEDKK